MKNGTLNQEISTGDREIAFGAGSGYEDGTFRAKQYKDPDIEIVVPEKPPIDTRQDWSDQLPEGKNGALMPVMDPDEDRRFFPEGKWIYHKEVLNPEKYKDPATGNYVGHPYLPQNKWPREQFPLSDEEGFGLFPNPDNELSGNELEQAVQQRVREEREKGSPAWEARNSMRDQLYKQVEEAMQARKAMTGHGMAGANMMD